MNIYIHPIFSGRGCPADWMSWNRGCYYISDKQKNFEDAQAFCKDYGADMLNIETEEEFLFIDSLLQGYQHNGEYFIGSQFLSFSIFGVSMMY